jgi:hypothetical protein
MVKHETLGTPGCPPTHTHTHRHTDTRTHGHTYTQAHRHTDTQAEVFAKFDLSEFELYLQKNTNMRDERSRKYCVLNLHRFFYLLDIPDGSDPIGVLCSIHRTGVMAKVVEAPLMDHRYTWARSMFSSLDNFTKFCIMSCNRLRFMEAKALLQGFIDETITGLLKKGVMHRKGADQTKRLRDSDRLAYFPDIELVKAEVKGAMARIAVIRQHCIDEGILHDLPFRLRLTHIMYSIGHIISQVKAGSARYLFLSLSRSLARPLARSLALSIARSLARSIDRSLARSLSVSLARSLARSLSRSLSLSLSLYLDACAPSNDIACDVLARWLH